MAFLGKTYALDRSENFEEYVKALKLPEDITQRYLNNKDSQKLEKAGDEYVLTTFVLSGTVEVKFKNGVEFDDHIRPTVIAKSTYTLEGNKLTHVQKFSDGNVITIVREYSPDQLVTTFTTNFWSGSSKKFYVAQ